MGFGTHGRGSNVEVDHNYNVSVASILTALLKCTNVDFRECQPDAEYLSDLTLKIGHKWIYLAFQITFRYLLWE